MKRRSLLYGMLTAPLAFLFRGCLPPDKRIEPDPVDREPEPHFGRGIECAVLVVNPWRRPSYDAPSIVWQTYLIRGLFYKASWSPIAWEHIQAGDIWKRVPDKYEDDGVPSIWRAADRRHWNLSYDTAIVCDRFYKRSDPIPVVGWQQYPGDSRRRARVSNV
jgi:hypothetical protein